MWFYMNIHSAEQLLVSIRFALINSLTDTIYCALKILAIVEKMAPCTAPVDSNLQYVKGIKDSPSATCRL